MHLRISKTNLIIIKGVPLQQNWAYENDVNLLASGGNLPLSGHTGSGIYAGKLGPILSRMSGINETLVKKLN